jgi:hypothetical protein
MADNKLADRTYYPAFCELPQADDTDYNYYSETPEGRLLPNRTWCFAAEIVSDALAHIPELGHRVEVRDVFGDVRSILFYPTNGTLDFRMLKSGHTVFIRYASRVFFSDLATEALKVEDLDLCCIIPCGMDILYSLSHAYFGSHTQCLNCPQQVQAAGHGSAQERACIGCGCSRYCSAACMAAHRANHMSHCRVVGLLGQVVNIDYDRFVDWVTFR